MAWSWAALPERLIRRIRRQLERTLLGHYGISSVRVARAHAGGAIDRIELGDDGTLAVLGWGPDLAAFSRALELRANGAVIGATHTFRVTRADLGRLSGDRPERLGIIVEFVLPPEWAGATATLVVASREVASLGLPIFTQPAYSEFYGNPGVLHRSEVYGVGPPVRHVSTEILTLCDHLQGASLDFGCGAGALVAALRERGIDAVGLELDMPHMRDAALPAARPHISYYPGTFPAPFADGAFRNVTCCEVLEHIADYQGAIAELARLASDRLVVTVPDMSGIPRGYAHSIVPWHLLEGTHVNFFTQQSLETALRPHVRDIQFFRVGEVRCNRVRFYTTLVALCAK